MPKYVLNRNYRLAEAGHSIDFVKGQPVWVPPELEIEAVKIGAEPVEGEKPSVLPPEPEPTFEPEGADREALLFAAYEQIIAENERDCFSAQGIPTVKAVKNVVGFDVSKREIDETFRKYKQSLE